MHNKIFISADFEAKNFRRKLEKLAKFFCIKIDRNEKFIIQMAYGDKNIFYNFFLFIIEKFDFLVEIPPEREVLWFFSEGQIIRISLSLIPNAPCPYQKIPFPYQIYFMGVTLLQGRTVKMSKQIFVFSSKAMIAWTKSYIIRLFYLCQR